MNGDILAQISKLNDQYIYGSHLLILVYSYISFPLSKVPYPPDPLPFPLIPLPYNHLPFYPKRDHPSSKEKKKREPKIKYKRVI